MEIDLCLLELLHPVHCGEASRTRRRSRHAKRRCRFDGRSMLNLRGSHGVQLSLIVRPTNGVEFHAMKTIKWEVFFWLRRAICIASAGLVFVGYLLHQFDINCAELASGTEIRPMGLTAVLGMTGIASIVLGGGCALVATIQSVRHKRRQFTIVSLASLALTCAPLVFGFWGVTYVVDLHKLVIAD
jgi:hypothetical protein